MGDEPTDVEAIRREGIAHRRIIDLAWAAFLARLGVERWQPGWKMLLRATLRRPDISGPVRVIRILSGTDYYLRPANCIAATVYVDERDGRCLALVNPDFDWSGHGIPTPNLPQD